MVVGGEVWCGMVGLEGSRGYIYNCNGILYEPKGLPSPHTLARGFSVFKRHFWRSGIGDRKKASTGG